MTGASSGLGRFIAKHLDAAGASVTLHYNDNEEGAESLALALENPTQIVQADLNEPDSSLALFKRAAPIDILVNCAAAESQDLAELKALDSNRWRNTQKANVESPFLLIQQLAFQSRTASVINISSIAAIKPSTVVTSAWEIPPAISLGSPVPNSVIA